VGDVGFGQGAPFAVVEPLLGGLVAADAKGPGFGRNVLEVLRGVEVDAALGFTVAVADVVNVVGAGNGVADAAVLLFEGGVGKQVQGDEFFADGGGIGKCLGIGRQRDTREVALEGLLT
jgi:hypothetical protein